MDPRGNRIKLKRGILSLSMNVAGTSLISVIVAFALLLVGIALFTTAMTVSLNLTKKAQEIRVVIEETAESYYTKNGSFESLFDGEIYFWERDAAGSNQGFSITGQCRKFTYNKEGKLPFLLYDFTKT